MSIASTCQTASLVEQPQVGSRGDFRRRLWYKAAVCPEFLEAFWTDPDKLIAAARPLKRGNRCTVALARSSRGPLVVKRFNLRGRFHTLAHTVKRSRATLNWHGGHRLQSLGVATPEPLACLEHRLGPLRFRSFVVLPYLDGWRMHTFLAWHQVSRDQMQSLGQQFLFIRQAMVSARLTHGDLRADNLLITASGNQLKLWLIDLDSLRSHRSDAALQHYTQRDTKRFFQDMAGYPPWLLDCFRG